jgi:hypothetical protein
MIKKLVFKLLELEGVLFLKCSFLKIIRAKIRGNLLTKVYTDASHP